MPEIEGRQVGFRLRSSLELEEFLLIYGIMFMSLLQPKTLDWNTDRNWKLEASNFIYVYVAYLNSRVI